MQVTLTRARIRSRTSSTGEDIAQRSAAAVDQKFHVPTRQAVEGHQLGRQPRDGVVVERPGDEHPTLFGQLLTHGAGCGVDRRNDDRDHGRGSFRRFPGWEERGDLRIVGGLSRHVRLLLIAVSKGETDVGVDGCGVAVQGRKPHVGLPAISGDHGVITARYR